MRLCFIVTLGPLGVAVGSQRLKLPLSVNEKKQVVMHMHVQLKLDLGPLGVLAYALP